jgi:hypothetical protein
MVAFLREQHSQQWEETPTADQLMDGERYDY